MYFLKAVIAAAASLAALSLTTPAIATVVTFDSQATLDPNVLGDGTTYSESGLTFTSSIVSPLALAQWGTDSSFNADPDGATLFQNYPNEFLVVTLTGGGSFTLNAFDLADVFNSGAAGLIPFSYVDGGGTHNSFLSLDNRVGLQTLRFNLRGVTSFTLHERAPFFQIDNVVFNDSGTPEPGAWAMMLVGMGGAGAMIRKRRQAF